MRQAAAISLSLALGGCGLIAGLGDFGDTPATTSAAATSTSSGSGGSGGGAGAHCGDQVKNGEEECDGGDVPSTCADLGFTGGTLACSVACAFDTTACTAEVTVPVPLAPENFAYIGSVHATGSMRPRFRWLPSTTDPPATVTYHLQYSKDPTFANEVIDVPTTELEHTPPVDLDGNMVVIPYGRKWFWRVNACTPSTCSDFGPVRRFVVGRPKNDDTGDGYGDVLAASHNASHVDITFGVAGITSLAPDDGRDGDALMTSFGQSLTAAGDIDGDGYGDVLVGAPLDDTGGADFGKVYVFFGVPAGPIANPAPITLTNSGMGTHLGLSLAGLGDVNGDGFADFAEGRDGVGCVRIHFGAALGTLDAAPDWQVSGALVFAAGDVNGDGYSDVLTQGPGANGAGEVFLSYGGPAATGDQCGATAFATGAAAYEALGRSAASGDINGDGYSDFVLGSMNSMTFDGHAEIWFGGKSGPHFVRTLSGPAASAFGANVGVGDLDGDGFGDVTVSSAYENGGQGRVRVYRGGPGDQFDSVDDRVLEGVASNDNFGVVAMNGDVDGDGLLDMVVGAPNRNGGAGAIYLYLGDVGLNLPLAASRDGSGSLGYFVASCSGRGPGVRGSRSSAASVGGRPRAHLAMRKIFPAKASSQ